MWVLDKSLMVLPGPAALGNDPVWREGPVQAMKGNFWNT